MSVLLTKNDPARGVGQLLTVLHKARGRLYEALATAEEAPVHRNPCVADAIKHLIALQTKGAVGAGTSAQTGWASELAPADIGRQAFMSWEGKAIAPRVFAYGARRFEWHTSYPKESASGMAAGWRGESLSAIVAKSATDTLRNDYREVVVITVATDELFRFGAVAEMALSRMVNEAVVTFTDTSFLDPTITATSARPASITNGALSFTSTGNTAAAMDADFFTMFKWMEVSSDGGSWVIVMRPADYYLYAARHAAVGLPTMPGFILGVPVVLGVKSPRQVTLIDASDFAFSTDETVTLDLSNESVLEMDSSPSQSGVSGVGSANVSLFQAGLTGIRATLPYAWQSIRPTTGSPPATGGVVYMPINW